MISLLILTITSCIKLEEVSVSNSSFSLTFGNYNNSEIFKLKIYRYAKSLQLQKPETFLLNFSQSQRITVNYKLIHTIKEFTVNVNNNSNKIKISVEHMKNMFKFIFESKKRKIVAKYEIETPFLYFHEIKAIDRCCFTLTENFFNFSIFPMISGYYINLKIEITFPPIKIETFFFNGSTIIRNPENKTQISHLNFSQISFSESHLNTSNDELESNIDELKIIKRDVSIEDTKKNQTIKKKKNDTKDKKKRDIIIWVILAIFFVIIVSIISFSIMMGYEHQKYSLKTIPSKQEA